MPRSPPEVAGVDDNKEHPHNVGEDPFSGLVLAGPSSRTPHAPVCRALLVGLAPSLAADDLTAAAAYGPPRDIDLAIEAERRDRREPPLRALASDVPAFPDDRARLRVLCRVGPRTRPHMVLSDRPIPPARSVATFAAAASRRCSPTLADPALSSDTVRQRRRQATRMRPRGKQATQHRGTVHQPSQWRGPPPATKGPPRSISPDSTSQAPPRGPDGDPNDSP